jgi:hypothetical protein
VVEPGDPDNSRLYLLVAHEEEPKMPPNAAKIPDAEIEVLRKWIEAGAPETSGSVVAVKEKPKLDFTLDPASVGKPRGEPAMPRGLSTEPVVASDRPNSITALAHSPWAPLVAVAGHKQVVLYHSKTHRLLGILPFPEGIIEVLRFTPDGELLLAGGGRGGQSGRVVVWDVKSGERLFEVGKEYDTVLAADISPDRGLVALGGPSKVLRVYNTSDGELAYECRKHTEWVTAVAFSPDGVLLASGDRNGGLLVWEGLTGREFHDLRSHTAMITDVSWRLDSNVLVSSSEDGSVRLWEMENGGNIKGWDAHGGGVESVRFAKDGRLVTTGRDRVAKVWDQNGGQQLQLDAFADVTLNAVFTEDDQAATIGDYSGEVRVHELKEGKLLGTLASNPEPLDKRLQTVDRRLDELASSRDAAAAELEVLREQAAAQSRAGEEAARSLAEIQKQAAEAAEATSAAETALGAQRQAEDETGAASSAAEELRERVLKLREAAQLAVRTREAAVKDAEAAEAMTHGERELTLLAEARKHLSRAVEEVCAKTPEWTAAIEGAAAARLAHERAVAARVELEARLALARVGASEQQAGLARCQAGLDAVKAARASGEQAVSAKSVQVAEREARIAALRGERDEMAAEKKALDEKAAGVQAAAVRAQAPGS